jgi:hypothetical protein
MAVPYLRRFPYAPHARTPTYLQPVHAIWQVQARMQGAAPPPNAAAAAAPSTTCTTGHRQPAGPMKAAQAPLQRHATQRPAPWECQGLEPEGVTQ